MDVHMLVSMFCDKQYICMCVFDVLDISTHTCTHKPWGCQRGRRPSLQGGRRQAAPSPTIASPPSKVAFPSSFSLRYAPPGLTVNTRPSGIFWWVRSYLSTLPSLCLAVRLFAAFSKALSHAGGSKANRQDFRTLTGGVWRRREMLSRLYETLNSPSQTFGNFMCTVDNHTFSQTHVCTNLKTTVSTAGQSSVGAFHVEGQVCLISANPCNHSQGSIFATPMRPSSQETPFLKRWRALSVISSGFFCL